ncbi:PREDICTED: growth arrest and DNA damage-inducible proteins-interacting protein 1 [Rhagoletis zephyria]|uniref:growth arrest and DNA damage-inducible proteins-interacting protein 1 n=1 Tax=Rhagoletis zephyria TaxID=28612 RepID=UPI00081142FC|nr:PREDICTED: growth arrest and DNA damage-inducible proteins-interacting protein 1 [Rhagoletis zephyria]
MFTFRKKIAWDAASAINHINMIQRHAFDTHSAMKQRKCESRDPSDNRNKSRLLCHNRKVLLNVNPYSEPCSWIHLTEKYQRKLFGRYGLVSASGPYICFNIRGKLNFIDDFIVEEKYSLQQLLRSSQSNLGSIETTNNREQQIANKLLKLEQWKVEMRNKIAKKEADALAAKVHKKRLIEEVRRHFGFKVDPREERFKEMLEQREREERKKQKEAKRKSKEEKIVEKLSLNSHR